MDPDLLRLAAVFPSIAVQLRGILSNLHLASVQLAPPAEREADPELDANAALLDQSYYQLLRLVNNLSATAWLRTEGPLPLCNRDVVRLVGERCQEAESLAREKGLHFCFRCVLSSHLCAIHEEGLEQLLFQLLSNAFKFTPSGGRVTVELQVVSGRVLLSVSDSGCGIEESLLSSLFDRYLHPELMSPSPHGLGLGLSLCRRIAEGMDGRLLAESRVGKGSRFTLSIPDRLTDSTTVSDVPFDYTGGFNRALLALADALPPSAFLQRNQE